MVLEIKNENEYGPDIYPYFKSLYLNPILEKIKEIKLA
jgi:hypothetical protein